nr:carbamoyltransferase HypF [Hymenobacter terricola]
MRGRVQGVGFRPLVFRLAQALGLCGTVSNGADGVHVHLQTDEATAADFLARVQAEAPPLAVLSGVEVAVMDQPAYAGFGIIESTAEARTGLWLTPDLGMCAACRAELHDPANRRFGYAFITCTDCGPRYSIAHGLPFDRAETSMAAFPPCPACAAEYADPANRRFHAQTISCPACGPALQGWVDDDPVPSGGELAEVDAQLRAGRTVAAKGIGGYLLLCDATNAAAVQRLRQRKHRPSKPLAVLYPDAETLRADCHLAAVELAELTSPAAPIVLLAVRETPASGVALAAVAPGLCQLGVMLPAAPLLELVARQFGRPLVATSGNISGSPIIYEDDVARTRLRPVADALLAHNRAIVVPQDDSVMRFSPRHQQRILLRRGRGLAPAVPLPTTPTVAASATNVSTDNADTPNMLAFGASLKSTFDWAVHGQVYASQYLGDLESFDTQEGFRHALAHFQQLLRVKKPAQVRADAHAGYFATQLATELATEWQVPLHLVQHHAAHLAAVLAEHAPSPAPTLGIIWDGTGYGTDGHIWGGEFLLNSPVAAEVSSAATAPRRLTHFAYFDALLGDKMPREPRLSAFSLARQLRGGEVLLHGKFTAREYDLYTRLLSHNQLKTSSVGRLFDAVASVLGLADVVSYEGEAALLLETLATDYVARHGYELGHEYLRDWDGAGNVPTQRILQEILDDVQADRPADFIAAAFHHSLISIIEKVAAAQGVRRLAFSGGVFQNALLVDLLIERLSRSFTLLFHQQLAPNDECIAFGQLFAADFNPTACHAELSEASLPRRRGSPLHGRGAGGEVGAGRTATKQ